jgi:hypothetical protein
MWEKCYSGPCSISYVNMYFNYAECQWESFWVVGKNCGLRQLLPPSSRKLKMFMHCLYFLTKMYVLLLTLHEFHIRHHRTR